MLILILRYLNTFVDRRAHNSILSFLAIVKRKKNRISIFRNLEVFSEKPVTAVLPPHVLAHRRLFSLRASCRVWISPFGAFSRHSRLLRHRQPLREEVLKTSWGTFFLREHEVAWLRETIA